MSSSNPSPEVLTGIACGPGRAYGPVCVIRYHSRKVAESRIPGSQTAAEFSRFEDARGRLKKELSDLMSRVHDKDTGDILQTYEQIIFDAELEKMVGQRIDTDHNTAEYAVYQTYCDFIEKLSESGSELFRQRISDLKDIRDKMVEILAEKEHHNSVVAGQIVVASDLSPTDVVLFSEKDISGIILERGGVTSHSSIIAHSLGIPCVVNVKEAVNRALKADHAAIDGDKGSVIFDPDKEQREGFSEDSSVEKADIDPRCPRETADGHSFRLMANLEFQQELPRLLKTPYEGIGLLRTEGLMLGKVRADAAEQEAYYRQILDETEGPVTVRLFDLGGDKLNISSEQEKNPFLGWRGIRMLLDEGDLLDDQLKALIRLYPDYEDRLRLLVPMISTLEEIRQVREKVERVSTEIHGNSCDIPIGVMVEVPAVALKADHFAREADFFSIGTNDLTQYTLAVDRGNQKINALYRQYDPSVLKLIWSTVKAANEQDIPVSLCGELAGTEVGAFLCMGLGVYELSMTPRMMPGIQRSLSAMKLSTMQEFAKTAMTLGSASEVCALYEEITVS